MNRDHQNAELRATQFAQAMGTSLLGRLGWGYDGLVFGTDRGSAIKTFLFEKLFTNELAVYHRLKENAIYEIDGCRIPRLLSANHELWIIEMGIVQPPFVLDFASAYLDRRPEYPEDVYAEWIEEKADQFGTDWPRVQSIMSSLAGHGIYLADVKPGNITFR